MCEYLAYAKDTGNYYCIADENYTCSIGEYKTCKSNTEVTKCEYCDSAKRDKNKLGYNFEPAKYCPMCGNLL